MEVSLGPHKGKDRIADPDEVRRAVAALNEAELLKLHLLAGLSAYRLRRRIAGIDGKDLLQEAVARLLQGARRWKPERVDLVGLLGGVITSIESGLRETAKRGELPILESDLLTTYPAGEALPSVLQQTADSRPDPERELISSEARTREQLLQEVEELFLDDPLPALILSEWKRGTKGPEIMNGLDLTRQQYDTAVRRMYRAIQKRWPGGMPDVR